MSRLNRGLDLSGLDFVFGLLLWDLGVAVSGMLQRRRQVQVQVPDDGDVVYEWYLK